MKAPVRLPFILLLLAALACNLPGAAVGLTPTAPATGRTVTLGQRENEVFVRQGADGAETPAATGAALGTGAVIETRGDGKARLDLPEAGNLIRMGPGTSLTIQNLQSDTDGPLSQFALGSGIVWIVLNESGGEAVVETPGGTASTRGQMSVEYVPNDGSGASLFVVTCLVGPCAANNAFNGVTLSPGQQSEATGEAGLAPPHGIDDERLKRWQAEVPEASAAEEGATPTASATAGLTPSPTPSPTPTYTATPSLTPTNTLIPFTPTHTFIPITLTPSFTPTVPTLTPSFTPTNSAPTASISADSTTIHDGDCTTLRWTATNAREVYLNNQGIAGETSREVCPHSTTVYTLRVVGYDNSSVESSVTITVEPSDGSST